MSGRNTHENCRRCRYRRGGGRRLWIFKFNWITNSCSRTRSFSGTDSDACYLIQFWIVPSYVIRVCPIYFCTVRAFPSRSYVGHFPYGRSVCIFMHFLYVNIKRSSFLKRAPHFIYRHFFIIVRCCRRSWKSRRAKRSLNSWRKSCVLPSQSCSVRCSEQNRPRSDPRDLSLKVTSHLSASWIKARNAKFN